MTGFLRRDEQSGQVWDSTPLTCPARLLTTTTTVLTVPADVLSETGRARRDAGVHALEHLLVGLLPALVANDRSDVGAHSWLGEAGLGRVEAGEVRVGEAGVGDARDGEAAVATIAVFDQQPGSGFAARAYERADAWLRIARERIEACACETGCPACILASGCSSTRPLDKGAARRLLAVVAVTEPVHAEPAVGRREETGSR